MSTEQVFASKENAIYEENSKQNSKLIYGKSKALTEKSISDFENVCILRSSMIYGYQHYKKQNLFNYVDVCSGNFYEIYIDAFSKPTLIDELCNCIDYIIMDRICGIRHAVGSLFIDRVSLLQKFLKQQYSHSIVEDIIRPVKTPENSDIQKYIDIRTSPILERFFQISFEDRFGIPKKEGF